MAIDWLKSSNKQRVDLYEAVSRLFKMRELTLEILFRDALGKSPDTITPAFTENFRKGKISTSNAALIYRYLRENFQGSIAHWLLAHRVWRVLRTGLYSSLRFHQAKPLPRKCGTFVLAIR